MKSFTFIFALFAIVVVSVCNGKTVKNLDLKTNVRALRVAKLRLSKTMRAVRIAEKKLRQTNRAIKMSVSKLRKVNKVANLETSEKFIDGVFDSTFKHFDGKSLFLYVIFLSNDLFSSFRVPLLRQPEPFLLNSVYLYLRSCVDCQAIEKLV